MASINFGPETGVTARDTEVCMVSPARYKYLDKLQAAIDHRLEWDGDDRSQLLLPGDSNCSYNTPGEGGIGSDYLHDRRSIYINRYLDSNMKLWVWDFDDTLINSRAYIWHAMDPKYISLLSEQQLSRDFPHWKYWRRLVLYLVQSGHRVGIASFGYYPIIKAYMDRVFGINQHIFDANNIHSLARGASGERDWGNMPTNKNAYIQRLMLYYKVPSPQQVIFFDDRASNIADAIRMGVVAIQVSHRYGPTGQRLDCRDLFGPQTMMQVSRQLQDGECVSKLGEQPGPILSWFGDRRAWKYQAQRQGFEDSRRLVPNPEVGGVSNTPDDFVWSDDTSQRQRIIENMVPEPSLDIKEGFQNVARVNNKSTTRDSDEPVCVDCKSPLMNWLILCIFILTIAAIASLVIWG